MNMSYDTFIDELSEEFIKSLSVDETHLIRSVAEKSAVREDQVRSLISLFADGCTIPFIARYRKEKTGSLDEAQIRDIEHRYSSGKNLETRRIEIIRLIFEQGKLRQDLYRDIFGAATLAELEDIYSPYKRRKKTRGMIAHEKGLEPLAQAMRELETRPLLAKAAMFVRPAAECDDPALAVTSVEDALQGAMDIIAEAVYRDPKNRSQIKTFYLKDGKIIVKGPDTDGKTVIDRSDTGNKGAKGAGKAGVYRMYWDFSEALSQIKAHRILAINRGEREGVLRVTVDVDEANAVQMIQSNYVLHNDYHKTAIEDGIKRLLSPALIREIRGDHSSTADEHGIGVFSGNLKNLLLRQPIKGTRVMGIDPGIRTGTKCVFLDDTGKYLGNIVIFNNKAEEAKQLMLKGVREYDVQLIAVGNGTGSHDVQQIITELIAENSLEVFFTVVDEDGASVYSASDIAREEFPDLDVTIRGAVSIGRRLQDPLAELVKIDPKSIGVGMYQHDVNQKKLSDTLDEVVSSVVNNVGVNLNTASMSLLKYVSGINGALARKIVQYRDKRGRISSRAELAAVSGMGPKSFEQCAGFLKIPESAEPLDNTWIHPENYAVARDIRNALTASSGGNSGLDSGIITSLREKYSVGNTTIHDIADELKKPNRDPRDTYPKPIMRKGIVTFEDLREGMMISGKIKNVVDFGAFVDLGIKETALVHISQMSDHFVKDPLNTVKAGTIMEFRVISLDTERRRIGLSLKSNESQKGEDKGNEKKKMPKKNIVSGRADDRKQGKRRSLSSLHSGAKQQSLPRVSPSSVPNDDGTMYRPFADAFR